MELRELRSFVAAARLRSITKAAEELSIGQPTATTHIKKLEQELGTLLFDRIKRPIPKQKTQTKISPKTIIKEENNELEKKTKVQTPTEYKIEINKTNKEIFGREKPS